MRRAVRIVLLLLALPATAAARPSDVAVSESATGTAVVGWVVDDSGVRVALGRTDALGPPIAIGRDEGLVRQLWVVAAPDGGARVVWEARSVDYALPEPPPRWMLRSVLVSADGNVGPEQVVTTGDQAPITASVVSNTDGDALAVWPSGAAAAASGMPFTPETVAIPTASLPVAALAPGGAAMIVGRPCFPCDFVAMDRRPGGAFGAPRPIVGSADVGQISVALASDGSAVVAGTKAGGVSFQRPPGGTAFGSEVDFGGLPFAASAGASPGGRAIVAFADSSHIVVHTLPGAGVASFADTWPDAPRLSAAADGSGLVGLTGPALATVGVDGSIGDRVALQGPSDGFPPAVSGSLAAWVTLTGAVRASDGQVLATYPPRVDDSQIPRVEIARRVRRHAGIATIGLRCVSEASCAGTLTVNGTPVPYSVRALTGTALRVPTHARVLRITVGGATLRRVTTSARGCACRPWAATIAHRGRVRLLVAGRPKDASFVATTAYACVGRQRQVVRTGRQRLLRRRAAHRRRQPALRGGRRAGHALSRRRPLPAARARPDDRGADQRATRDHRRPGRLRPDRADRARGGRAPTAASPSATCSTAARASGRPTGCWIPARAWTQPR